MLHCPTFRGPFSSRVPLVVTVHDLAVLRHPEWFNRWTRTYSRLAVPRVVRAADRVIAVSEFTPRSSRDCSPSRRRRFASCRTASRPVFTPEGQRAEGDYVLAVGTLEPRKNLEPDRGRRRGRAARRRRARLGRASRRPANVVWLGEIDDDELARHLPRRPLPGLRLALRGLRDPGRRGARLRLCGGDEPRQPDGRARRRRRGLRRPDATSPRSAPASPAPSRRRRGGSPSGPEVARATTAVYEELA